MFLFSLAGFVGAYFGAEEVPTKVSHFYQVDTRSNFDNDSGNNWILFLIKLIEPN